MDLKTIPRLIAKTYFSLAFLTLIVVDSQGTLNCNTASGACYRFESTSRTQADAARVCEGYEETLVSVTDSNLQTELQQVMDDFDAEETWLRGMLEPHQ